MGGTVLKNNIKFLFDDLVIYKGSTRIFSSLSSLNKYGTCYIGYGSKVENGLNSNININYEEKPVFDYHSGILGQFTEFSSVAIDVGGAVESLNVGGKSNILNNLVVSAVNKASNIAEKSLSGMGLDMRFRYSPKILTKISQDETITIKIEQFAERNAKEEILNLYLNFLQMFLLYKGKTPLYKFNLTENTLHKKNTILSSSLFYVQSLTIDLNDYDYTTEQLMRIPSFYKHIKINLVIIPIISFFKGVK